MSSETSAVLTRIAQRFNAIAEDYQAIAGQAIAEEYRVSNTIIANIVKELAKAILEEVGSK